MKRPLNREDVIGKTISRLECKTEVSDSGFNYSEAIVVLDSGIAFAVNEAGVDEESDLLSCDIPKKCVDEVFARIKCMLGRRITNIVIAESIPTLVVLSDRDALFGIDGGPPFHTFGPTTSRVGEYIDYNEMIDFWNREPVSV